MVLLVVKLQLKCAFLNYPRMLLYSASTKWEAKEEVKGVLFNKKLPCPSVDDCVPMADVATL